MTSKLSKSDKSSSLTMVGSVQIREVAVALVIRVRITIRDQLPGFISDSLTAAAILLFFLGEAFTYTFQFVYNSEF